MKKRLFAIITAIAMVFAMLPNMPDEVHAAAVTVWFPLNDKTFTYGEAGKLRDFINYAGGKKDNVQLTPEEVKEYDGSNSIAGLGIAQGVTFTITDSKNITYPIQTYHSSLPAGKYTLTATYPNDPESTEVFVFEPATITVNEKNLTASDFNITVTEKVYDGTKTAEVTATVKSLVAGDTNDTVYVDAAEITGAFKTPSSGTNKEVEYTITELSGSSANNYKLPEGGLTGTVNTGTITCTHPEEHLKDATPENGKLISAADCENPATYYRICKCEATTNTTFTVGEKLGHAYGKWESIDETQHKRTCANDPDHIEALPHTSGAAATCKAPQTCTDCGYELAAKIDHKYDAAWKSDSNQHWHECTYNCGTKSDISDHSYTKKVVNEGTLVSAATCTEKAVYRMSCECGAISKTETFEDGEPLSHDYDDWKKLDETKHQRTCKRDNCGHVEMEEHSGGSPTCESPATCTDCDAQYTGATGHDWGEWENLNETQHKRICKNDTSHIEISEHTGGTPTCTEQALCSECYGYYGEALGHNWGEWEQFDNNRTLHRSVCKNDPEEHIKYEEHEMTFECGQDAKDCKCGMKASKTHNFDKSKWLSDEEFHWHGCKNCTAREDETEHNYPNKEMIGKVPQTCTECDYGGHITRLDDSEFDAKKHITSALKNKGYHSELDIKEGMLEQATEKGENIPEQKALYDVMLEYSKDGGMTWAKASAEHFPDDGQLVVTLPVPKGTSIGKHDYKVVHMFSQTIAFKDRKITAGDVEFPEVHEGVAKDGTEYISFYVTGLSPIMVAWEETPELNSRGIETTDDTKDETKDETPDDTKDEKKYPIDEDGDGEVDFYLSEDEFNADDYVAVDEDGDSTTDYYVPKDVWDEDDNVGSGDDSNILPWILVMMTALTAAAITVIGRRYRRN